MTPADWDIIIKACAALMTSVVIPWAILAYQRRTGVAVTDQQRAAVYSAIQTATGIIQTQFDQGKMTAQVTPGNSAIQAEARIALATVPDAAKAQGATVDMVARKIVANVDIIPRTPAPVVPIAPAEAIAKLPT